MIDFFSQLNITSLTRGPCHEDSFEQGIKDLQQANALQEPDTDDNEVSSEILDDLRSKSIKDLKLVCSKRSIRYKGLKEQEELVQAIVNDIMDLTDFSVSGHLVPGTFNEISGDILEEERHSEVPLLLDVYATFCGPCKCFQQIGSWICASFYMHQSFLTLYSCNRTYRQTGGTRI